MIFDETDKQFIAEVYPDGNWSVAQIAETLDKTPSQIRTYVKTHGIRRKGIYRFDSTDKEFIRATFTDPEWTVAQIAEKLGVNPGQVRSCAQSLGLRRPHGRKNTPRLDWREIWEVYQSTGCYRQTAIKLRLPPPTIRYAMQRMLSMTPGEREGTWQRYDETSASTSDQ